MALFAVPAQARPVKASDLKGVTLPPIAHIKDATKPPEVGTPASTEPTLSLGSLDSTVQALTTPTYPNDTLKCSSWGYIAGKANSYVTGNCGPGWLFDRRQKTGAPLCNNSGRCYYWYGGYIGYDYGGCGWIRDVDAKSYSTTTHTGCAPGTIEKQNCDYIYCPNGEKATFGGTDDGVVLPLKLSCYLVANIRPWLDNQTLKGQLSGPYPPSATRFKVRYVAKYTIGGYAFLMVHDTAAPAGQPNWGFMPWGCF
jgi:hypothetical protein